MELILAVLAVAVIVAGTVWTMRGLKLIRNVESDADIKHRLLELEVACHDLKRYIDQRTPQAPPDIGSRPPHIPGKDREIDGFGSEVVAGPMMGPGELGE